MSANRVAALAAFLTSLGALIAGITQDLPNQWQDAAISAVGVIGAVVTALHFMTGSQKYDALVAQNGYREMAKAERAAHKDPR